MKPFRSEGFTLLELIVVIVILGVITISAFSRFASSDAFALRVEQDRLISILHLVQQSAMAGQPVSFAIEDGSYQFRIGESLENYRVAGVQFPQPVAEGITITPSSLDLTFVDNLGTPDSTPLITLSDNTGDSVKVCLSAAGFAYGC